MNIAAGEVSGITTGTVAIPHNVVWGSNVVTDIDGVNESAVTVRLTASDSDLFGVDTAASFAVHNNAERPIAVITPITRAVNPDVAIEYKLVDSEDLIGSITAEYSNGQCGVDPTVDELGCPEYSGCD